MNLCWWHSIVFGLIFLSLPCCDGKNSEEELLAKQEEVKRVVQNSCTMDEECFISGCHQTVCRATVEKDFCEHRLVVEMSSEDVDVLELLTEQILDFREAETLRIGGSSAGHMMVSFHAPPSQRTRVIEQIEASPKTGLFFIKNNASLQSEALYRLIKDKVQDVSLRRTENVGFLVEKTIRSGDILSKDDIRDAWSQIQPYISQETDLFWTYDILHDSVPKIRLWPLSLDQFIPITDWENFSSRLENGDLRILGTVVEQQAKNLAHWSEEASAAILTLGRSVVAAASVNQSVEGGKFEFIIKEKLANSISYSVTENLERMRFLLKPLQFDEEETKKVERDLECNQRHPRKCGCLEGKCSWIENADYQSCMR